MSVTFFTGKPGGGKSLLACRVIIKELVETDRHVVTNVPLKVVRLVEYVRVKYGREIDPERITILDDEQTKVFFLHRAGRHVAPMPVTGTDGEIDYSACKGPDGVDRDNSKLLPVLYVVDEAHNKFGARDWAKTGRAAMWYLSQHRHFGDDVIFVTQHWKNVDSGFRRLAQEFTTSVNLSKRRAFGFKLPSVFMLRTFDSEPTAYATEVWTETHRLDVDGLCSCYSTVAVKSAAGLADTAQGKKGWPWQVGVALVILGLGAVFLIPLFLGKGMNWMLLKGSTGLSSVTNTVQTVGGKTNAPAGGTNSAKLTPATDIPKFLRAEPPPAPLPQLGTLNNGAVVLNQNDSGKLAVGSLLKGEAIPRVRFFARSATACVLGLENGDVLRLGDGRLEIYGDLAIVDGQRVYRLPR